MPQTQDKSDQKHTWHRDALFPATRKERPSSGKTLPHSYWNLGQVADQDYDAPAGNRYIRAHFVIASGQLDDVQSLKLPYLRHGIVSGIEPTI
jgi:hypothetical protein